MAQRANVSSGYYLLTNLCWLCTPPGQSPSPSPWDSLPPSEEGPVPLPSMPWHTSSLLTPRWHSSHLLCSAHSVLLLWSLPISSPSSPLWPSLSQGCQTVMFVIYVIKSGPFTTAVLQVFKLYLLGGQQTALDRHLFHVHRHKCIKVSPKWQRTNHGSPSYGLMLCFQTPQNNTFGWISVCQRSLKKEDSIQLLYNLP